MVILVEYIDYEKEELILEAKEVLIEISNFKQQLLEHVKSLTELTIH